MHQSPTVFLSYCQRQSEIKDFFVSLLEDMGLRAEVFDYGVPDSVVDRQKYLIESCDGFLALLTPDEETADGCRICSMSVNQEIGMAFQAGKPFQLFAFNDVDFGRVQVSQVTTVAKFSTLTDENGALVGFDSENIRQIFRAMLEFKQRLDSIHAHKAEDAFFSYKNIRVEQRLVSEDQLVLHNSVEAVALKSLHTHTHAARLLCDRGRGDGIKLEKDTLEFKLIRPRDASAKTRITENTHSSFRFYIDFQRPVQAGTELKYAYRRRHFNYLPYTMEELEEVVKEGKLSNRVMASHVMIGQDFFITQPTEQLSISLHFPVGYRIDHFKALACEYRGDQVQHAETERVSELARLEHEEFDDKFILHLDVPRPRMNCTYFLLYKPPSEQELRSEP